MMKQLLIVAAVTASLSVAACSKNKGDDTQATSKAPKRFKFHGDGAKSSGAITPTPIAGAMKKKKLKAFPQKTIGEAFDSYGKAVSKEWREDMGKDGRYYVDYICWFDPNSLSPEARKAGFTKRGLDVKFVIHGDGDAYITLATRLFVKGDGSTVTDYVGLSDLEKMVEDIYQNRELNF